MRYLFKILLTINATSLICVLYLIKSEMAIPVIFECDWYETPKYFSYILYLIVPLLSTYISLVVSKKWLPKEVISVNSITDLEQANNAYLPSYLGYFFVALSVNNCNTLIFVFVILFAFTFLSQTLYFNPLFLIWGYKFYYLTTNKNVKIFVITKKEFRNPEEIELINLRRINDFTFIDKD